MAKIKSVKFYNFTETIGEHSSINVYFYNKFGKIIPLDFSNCIKSPTSTYNETSEYIVTGTGCYDSHYFYFPCQAFHTGNTNKNLGLTRIGHTWILIGKIPNSNDFIKIEFKFPQYISNIKILHSFRNGIGFTSCSYDIEFSNGIIENKIYNSNGQSNIYSTEEVNAMNYNQETYDSQFDSINFNKSISIYDTKIGYTETLDTNNFRNIPINGVKKLKSLCTNPLNTHLNCLISFDKKQTWKTFNGTKWITIVDISPENIILNGMEISGLNQLDKDKLIAGGFIGDLDFKITMKTNDENETPSVTKIYIEYK